LTSLIILSTQLVHAQDERNQQNIITDLTTNLINQGVPIISITTTNDSRWEPSTVIQCVLQSTSTDDELAPMDPTYSNVVGHAINLAQKIGLNVGAISTIFVNAEGKVLTKTTRRIKDKSLIISKFEQPGELSVNEMINLMDDVPMLGMAITELNAVPTQEGLFKCRYDIEAESLEMANENVPTLMPQILKKINELNLTFQAGIFAYQIYLTDKNGDILLQYINDVQLGRESWWQSDSLTKEWFPHPPIDQ
jgi:hypothetical protein